MADYGSHPTKFSSLTNDALFSMYRGEHWAQMDEFERRELLQETVNRSAVANGELGACRVEFADLGSTTAGVQHGDVIQLDRSRFVNDVVVHEYNGRVIEMPLSDANIQALETVLHEDIHAWQNQCIDGTITCADSNLLEEYKANNFDISVVQKADGTMDIGQQYLSGESQNGGYYLYFFQSTERDAHRISEMRTMKIVEHLEQKYGTEASFASYRQTVAVNGYKATLESAKNHFGTENVEKDINTTLKNQYYKTNTPVSSAAVEEAVKNEMIVSLQESMKLSQAETQTQVDTPEHPHNDNTQTIASGPADSVNIVPEIPDNGMEM